MDTATGDMPEFRESLSQVSFAIDIRTLATLKSVSNINDADLSTNPSFSLIQAKAIDVI